MAEKTRVTLAESDKLDKLTDMVKSKQKSGEKITAPWVKKTLDSCGYDASENVCREIRSRVLGSTSVVRTKKSGNYGPA